MSPSSTSSSDARSPAATDPARPGSRSRSAFPVAGLACLAVFVAAEVAVRALPGTLLAFDQESGWISDYLDYVSVRLHERVLGPADAIAVGSSRTRVAFDSTVIAPMVEEARGGAIDLRNYACAGAEVETSAFLLRWLALRDRLPAVVLWGVSPRQFRAHPPGGQVNRAFWFDPSDETYIRSVGAPVSRGQWVRARHLAFMDRVPSTYLSYGILYQAGSFLTLRWNQLGLPSNPAGGGPSSWTLRLQGDPSSPTSLVTRPLSDEHVAAYVARLGHEAPIHADETRVACFRRIVSTVEQAGSRLVIFELPFSDILRRHYPPEFVADYEGILAEAEELHAIPVVRLRSLDLRLGDADFREQSHLNVQGVAKFSAALGGRLAEESLL